eukprot:GILJ01004915.1.p1 GENE.GILJ01004915.1~~GILJ01004915.1.p1  ORF type:complete len:237 (-),score=46.00 GILJ01004915.1:156-866(-)
MDIHGVHSLEDTVQHHLLHHAGVAGVSAVTPFQHVHHHHAHHVQHHHDLAEAEARANDTVDGVLSVMKEFGMKQCHVVHESGVSAGIVSQFLARKYNTSSSNVEERLRKWVEERRAKGPPSAEYPLPDISKQKKLKASKKEGSDRGKRIKRPLPTNLEESNKELKKLRKEVSALKSQLIRAEQDTKLKGTEVALMEAKVHGKDEIIHELRTNLEKFGTLERLSSLLALAEEKLTQM